jgi:hypothetical protein
MGQLSTGDGYRGGPRPTWWATTGPVLTHADGVTCRWWEVIGAARAASAVTKSITRLSTDERVLCGE